VVTTIYTFATGLVPVFCAVPCTIYVPLLEAIAPLCSRIVILGCELVHPDKITIDTKRTKQIKIALFIVTIYHTTFFVHENKDWLGNAAWHLFSLWRTIYSLPVICHWNANMNAF
jgi:hypothetical protein